MEIDKKYRLVILDCNGTVASTPFKDKKPIHLLPGREKKCAELQMAGKILALVSNQEGVALGHATEREATREVKIIADALHIDIWYVSFGYPKPIKGLERYMEAEHMIYRKPSPGMLFMARDDANVPFDQVLYVGDRPEDELAAKCAGIDYMDASVFFGDTV